MNGIVNVSAHNEPFSMKEAIQTSLRSTRSSLAIPDYPAGLYDTTVGQESLVILQLFYRSHFCFSPAKVMEANQITEHKLCMTLSDLIGG